MMDGDSLRRRLGEGDSAPARCWVGERERDREYLLFEPALLELNCL